MKAKFLVTVFVTLSLIALFIGACSTPAPAPTTPAPTSKPTASPSPSASPTATAKPSATPLEIETWRISTQAPGNWTHTIGTGIARVVDKYAQGVKLLVTIAPASGATHYLYEKNELDAAYGGNLDLMNVYNNKAAFATQPVSYRTFQGLYLATTGTFFLTKKDTANINSFKDLAGKKLFPFTSGSGTYTAVQAALTAVGVWDKISDRQMGITAIADAFKTNAIDATAAYVTGYDPPPFLQDLDRQVQLRLIVPTDEEKQAISKVPGTAIATLPTSIMSQPLNVPGVWGFGNGYAWHFGPNEDEERVYQIVKALIEHADEVKAISPLSLGAFAESPQKVASAVYDATPGVPIHPGVAKYFKEKGWWKDSWTIGKLSPRPGK